MSVEVLSGAVRGAGDSFWPMIISASGICLLRIVWLLLAVGVAALIRRALKPALTAERGEALALPLCGWYAFAGAVLLFQHYFIGPVYVIYQ